MAPKIKDEFFRNRGIEIPRGCPQAVIDEVKELVTRAEAGEQYFALNGRKAKFDETVILFELGYRFRAFGRLHGAFVYIREVCTHETYNNRLAAYGGKK